MKSIKQTLSFLLIGISIYIMIMFVLSRIKLNNVPLIYQTNDFYIFKGGDTHTKFLDFNEDKGYDVIFVGSSRTYRGYDPEIFEMNGLTTWNLGSGNQTIDISTQIIKNYITPQNCKMLMVDLYPLALSGNPIESSSDLITNISKNSAALDIAINMKDSRALNLFVTRICNFDLNPISKASDYKGKGFCINQETYPEQYLEQPSLDSKIGDISAENLKKLESLLAYCSKKNINLVLVISPTTKFYTKELLDVFLSSTKPIIDKYNITLLDYSKKLNLNTKDFFYDADHMNYQGVKIFNKKLIENINIENHE